MNPRVIFAAILFAVIGISAAFMYGRSAPKPPPTSIGDISADEQGIPADSEGEVPVAEAKQIEHEFGVMELGTKGSHLFKITNSGKDVLKIKKGPSTCKCTVSDLPEGVIKEVAPGETVEVSLEWEPKNQEELFGQEATVWTNDPKMRRIDFRVHGRVVERVMIRPSSDLNAGFVDESKGATTEFYVCSESLTELPQPEIKVNDVERVQFEILPMTPSELAEHRLKTGYKVKLQLSPKIPVGEFRDTVAVVIPGQEPAFERDVTVSARRLGPITYIAKTGTVFYQQSLLFDLGYFKSSEGKVGEVTMIIDKVDPTTPVEILSVESDLPLIKATAIPNEQVNEQLPNKTAFSVKLEIHPGSPAVDRARATAPKITIKTSHPDVQEVIFRVELHGT